MASVPPVENTTDPVTDAVSLDLDAQVEHWRRQVASLSSRQRETLALLATGLAAHQIAAQMGVSEATVKTHLRQVYRKLGVNNRVAASLRFLQAAGDLRPRL
jgi:DNA-binding CsgD family transcriptional regulator